MCLSKRCRSAWDRCSRKDGIGDSDGPSSGVNVVGDFEVDFVVPCTSGNRLGVFFGEQESDRITAYIIIQCDEASGGFDRQEDSVIRRSRTIEICSLQGDVYAVLLLIPGGAILDGQRVDRSAVGLVAQEAAVVVAKH